MTVLVDPNMVIALSLSRGLAELPLPLPAALADIEARAAFILLIDKPLLVDAAGIAQWEEFGSHLHAIAQASTEVMAEVRSELDRVSIALALWSGCTMAAKAIAFETRSGKNTAAGRAEQFASIDELALQDALFGAGVEAAPTLKIRRAQPYSLDGVPHASPVRRYARQGQSWS